MYAVYRLTDRKFIGNSKGAGAGSVGSVIWDAVPALRRHGFEAFAIIAPLNAPKNVAIYAVYNDITGEDEVFYVVEK